MTTGGYTGQSKKPVGKVYLISIVLLLLLLSPIIAFEFDAHSGGNKWAKTYLEWLQAPPPTDDIAVGGNKFALLPTVWGYERVRCNGDGPLHCWKKK